MFPNMDENSILTLILLFYWGEYLWELFLTLRQIKVYRSNNSIPKDLEGVLNQESFSKARMYGIDKLEYRIVKDFYGLSLSSLVLYNRWIYYMWHKSEYVGAMFNIQPKYEILISCIFLLFVSLFSFVINIPLSIYETFVLEQKHGFNKQTIGFFIKDQLKHLILSIIIMLPISCGVIYIVMLGGNMFIIWLWLFITVVTILLTILYPTVIAPLFDKFIALPEGSLRTNIENLASQLKFPLSQVYIVEGSKRSAHSNAYFSGLFGAKRIVIFDTLIEKFNEEKNETTGCTENEILGVLAHELGHWKRSHIYKNMILVEINLLLIFMAFGALFRYSLLYRAIGFPPAQEPIIIGVVVILQMILIPYHSLLGYIHTVLSRKFEFEADEFGVSLNFGNELKSALIKLGKDNLDYPYYDKLYSSWHHSHPTLLQRIEYIKSLQKSKNE